MYILFQRSCPQLFQRKFDAAQKKIWEIEGGEIFFTIFSCFEGGEQDQDNIALLYHISNKDSQGFQFDGMMILS